MWVNLSTHLRQKEGEVSMTLSYCLPFKSLTLLMPVLCHASFQRLSNQFHSSPPEVKRVFRNVRQQSDLPDVRINMWGDTMWQHLERRSQGRLEHLNCRFMFSSLWFGPSTTEVVPTLGYDSKPSLCQSISTLYCRLNAKFRSVSKTVVLWHPLHRCCSSCAFSNVLGLVFLKVVFLSMLSHLHYQPALGPTANSYPGPTPPIINRNFWKNRVKICKNETVLQQDIIPNNFHSILGRRSWFRLRHCVCCKKNHRSPENKHHCNEVTCVSKSLFLTIDSVSATCFSLNSLTYPNYPYSKPKTMYLYISFYPSPLSPTHTWSKAPTSPRSSRSPPPTSTASWSSHDSCGEALAISFVYDIDVKQKMLKNTCCMF